MKSCINNRSTVTRSRRLQIWIGSISTTIILLLLVCGLWLRSQVLGSLAQLDGTITLQGLSAEVKIERDRNGVPTIRGNNRLDVAQALGFIHAQDRFFQMDLMRRQAAGKLAELFGPAALPMDREVRIHQFQQRAEEFITLCDQHQIDILNAYTTGVNSGLSSLHTKPFEYLLLRAKPESWQMSDTALVLYAMFLLLNMDYGSTETTPSLVYHTLPAAMADFLFQTGCEWDAPVIGEPMNMPATPGPEVFNLRENLELGSNDSDHKSFTEFAAVPALIPATEPAANRSDQSGSNNWAIAGTRSGHGRAMLANDMHLGIQVPNTWYRVLMMWPSSELEPTRNRLIGITLPGIPAMVIGSNSRIAWGFTNSYGDWIDLVIIETDPANPNRYRTPTGWREFSRAHEIIGAKGATNDTLEIVSTIWGPVVGNCPTGQPYAMRWIAHDPLGANLNLMRLEQGNNLDEALRLASRAGIPPQNFVCADLNGRIGWTIAGMIPQRVGFSGRLPQSWADGTRRWDGWLDPVDYPKIVDPEDGLIWTANARVVDGQMLAKIGDGGYALGARARQIRDNLLATDNPIETDLLAIQLDDRALLLEHWRELLLELAQAQPSSLSKHTGRLDSTLVANRTEFFRLVQNSWDGHASIGSVGYRLVRTFRRDVHRRIYGWLTAPSTQADANFTYSNLPQTEGVIWQLVTEKPMHLLTPQFTTWNEALLASVDSTAALFTRGGRNLADRTWGERNTTRIQHPISLAIPQLSRWLDMPARQLPGGSHMPRVVHPTSGASERLVVSPGYEREGIFHMPTGQSGHPFSPFYRAGHEAWAAGRPTPLMPGPSQHLLILRPE